MGFSLSRIFLIALTFLSLNLTRPVTAMNKAETALVEAAVKAIMKSQVGKASNNFSDLIGSIDCSKIACSPKTVCQYLNVGSYKPIDCSEYSDQNQVVSKTNLAIALIKSNLPEPESCKNIGHSVRPGQLIIGGPSPEVQACLNDKSAQKRMVDRNRFLIKSRYKIVDSKTLGNSGPMTGLSFDRFGRPSSVGGF